MPICLPPQCLALVYGLAPPGDPLFRESPGWWVRLRSVGRKHKVCCDTLHVTFFVPYSIFLVSAFVVFLFLFLSLGPLQ